MGKSRRCEHCKKALPSGSRSDKRFCDDGCARAAYAKTAKQHTIPWCEHCLEPVELYRRFCSKACTDKAWRTAKAAERAECTRRWRVENRDRKRVTDKAYLAAHPERVSAVYSRRRARKASAQMGESYTDLDVFVRDWGICHLCKYPVDPDSRVGLGWHIDHLYPLSRPGARHGFEWVSIAHGYCNVRRHNKTLEELDLPFDPPPGAEALLILGAYGAS